MRARLIPIFSFFSFLLSAVSSFGQLNMMLQDSMDYNVGVNDVCGWAAPDGREYALVGLNTGVSIVDINNDTLIEVAFVPGVNNLWRDINTFGHYAYVTSEAHVGLLIINLEFLPDSVQYHSWFGLCPTPAGDKPFEKAHSLNIDENGIAFLNGSNLNNGGCVLIDVKTNPEEPAFLAYSAAIYSHDCIARDSLLYSAEIGAGDASIYDFHDLDNITLVGRVKTPHEFTHNIALSADGNYMFTTDERANSYTTAYDITDKSNIIETDRFRQASVDGSGAIVHNAFTWEDWLVLAYYSSGTLIVDASRPDNLVEVGNFDSFLGGNGGYEGVWGAYPWLPSGKILASDRTSGLFVFIPNYVRAAFLEGTVIDSITGLPISEAEVSILCDEIVLPQSTLLDGTFKTGIAIPGTFPIHTVKAGYYPKTIEADFINGEILTPVIKLISIPVYTFSGKVINQDGDHIPFAKVYLSGQEGVFETQADANGNFLMPSVFKGTYEVQAGIWGQTMQSNIQLDAPLDITLVVEREYYDDFDLDLGWTVTGLANEGQWARGVPTRQLLFDMWECGSPTDSPFDLGENVYSTGLSTNPNVGNDEVSGGTTMLSSPAMDLDSITFPFLYFDYWICEFPPNQYLGFTVWLTNGEDTVLIREFRSDTTVGIGSWQRFGAHIDPPVDRDQIQILFVATDTTSGPEDYYLKVHVDNFRVIDGSLGTHDEYFLSGHFLIYPNPVNGPMIYLKAENDIEGHDLSLQICDVRGRIVSANRISKTEAESGIRHLLEDGIYFLTWKTEKGEFGVEKIIVMK